MSLTDIVVFCFSAMALGVIYRVTLIAMTKKYRVRIILMNIISISD
jgi:hypothetical protein